MDKNLPDFSSDAPAPPKRQRKQAPKKPRTPKKRSIVHAVKSISSGPAPKRARKKRPARRLPRSVAGHDSHNSSTGPLLAAEGAAVIRQFTALDETQKNLVLNYIQALR